MDAVLFVMGALCSCAQIVQVGVANSIVARPKEIIFLSFIRNPLSIFNPIKEQI